MANLTLTCGANTFLVDASASAMTVNSLGNVTFNATGTFIVDAAVQFQDFGAGLASFDGSGNLSSIAGTAFNAAGNQTVSGTWAFGSTVNVTGTTTLAGALINSGISTQASSIAIPSIAPPSGYSYVIVNNTSGQFYRMT
jgi:hypothetical protein